MPLRYAAKACQGKKEEKKKKKKKGGSCFSAKPTPCAFSYPLLADLDWPSSPRIHFYSVAQSERTWTHRENGQMLNSMRC